MTARTICLTVILAVPVLVAPVLGFAQVPGPQGQLRSIEERHACADAMGLNPANAPYDACVRSLDQTLVALGRAQSTKDHLATCDGLDMETLEYSACVVKALRN